MQCFVYILSNNNNSVLYTGVTSNLTKRIYEHKNHLDKGSFTDKYNVTKLIYFEETIDIKAAIEREKQIKGWKREQKIAMIIKSNPKFIDLYTHLLR